MLLLFCCNLKFTLFWHPAKKIVMLMNSKQLHITGSYSLYHCCNYGLEILFACVLMSVCYLDFNQGLGQEVDWILPWSSSVFPSILYLDLFVIVVMDHLYPPLLLAYLILAMSCVHPLTSSINQHKQDLLFSNYSRIGVEDFFEERLSWLIS